MNKNYMFLLIVEQILLFMLLQIIKELKFNRKKNKTNPNNKNSY
jgi:hypothetical protein